MALLIKYLLLLDWILMLIVKHGIENVLSKFSLYVQRHLSIRHHACLGAVFNEIIEELRRN